MFSIHLHCDYWIINIHLHHLTEKSKSRLLQTENEY